MILTIAANSFEETRRTQLEINWTRNISMEFAIKREQKEISDNKEPEERQNMT